MIYDISPLISVNIDVWPGDTSYTHELICSTDEGSNVTLSKITTTLHLGAHTDAPNHYGKSKPGIDQIDLNRYIGYCTVLDVTNTEKMRIYPEDLDDVKLHERVLLKTNSFVNHDQWNNDFKSCSADLIDHLNSQRVNLIGIDTPSIDLYDDKVLESHTRVLEHNMSILEGINLKDVPQGEYELIALPLKIKDADASPVRAILRDI